MRRQLAVLLIASFFTFFAGLGRAAISDSDEGFYAEAAREMVETGDWLTPHFDYQPRFEKPILYYWLAASAFSVLGPSEAAARLPSAASGLLLVLVTWCWGRRWTDHRVGFVAGLIAASNFGYFALGRLALPDLPLALFMTVTTWTSLEAAVAFGAAATDRQRTGRRWVLAAGAAAGLAFLMKGPVGVALPALTVLLAARLGLAGPARWRPFPVRDTLLGAALFLLVAVPWFAAMTVEHGTAYLHRFFIAENVERFATDRYNEPRSMFFYIPILLGGLAPWSPLAGLWVTGARRAWKTGRTSRGLHVWLLALCAAAPFVFYSLSVGKQPRYILPVLPPLAILLARTILSHLDAARGTAPRRALAWAGCVCGAVFLAFGLLLMRATPLLAGTNVGFTHLVAWCIAVGGLVVAVCAWQRPTAFVPLVTVVSIASLVGLQFSVFSRPGFDPVEQIAAAYPTVRRDNEPSGTHRVFVRNLVFYTRTTQIDLPNFEDLVAFLRRDERVLCVVRQRDLERLRRDAALAPHVLMAVPYFNAAGLRVDALVSFDRGRDLDTAYLIANQ